MPGLTGLELLPRAKAAAPDVDFIMLTAFGTVEEAVKAMKEGATDFLTKPFQRAQLVKVVRQALERRDLIAQNQALQQRLDALLGEGNVVGVSPAWRKMMDAGEEGGRQLRHRPDPGRERGGEGAGGARHPPGLVAAQRSVRGGQLRRAS